ncbi:PDZ domain-containing protein [Methyloversatilis discipulorum]|nr:PDZ domain-containing protein [Methyloversatilis discipulorum]
MRKIKLIALCCGAFMPASVAISQWAFLPPASKIVAVGSAKRIARCEAAFPAFGGRTERYLKELSAVAPGIIETNEIPAVSTEFLEWARSQSSKDVHPENCQKDIDNLVPQALKQLPCIVREERKMDAFRSEFDQTVRKYFDQGPNLPCTGILVKAHESRDSCERELAPITVDEVELNSPAERAGLMSGDELLTMANAKISFWREPELAELRAGIGSELKVSVKRGDIVLQRNITVGHRVIAPSESPTCRAQ